MKVSELCGYLIKNKYGPFINVPCSNLKEILYYLNENFKDDCINANNEGEVISLAMGALLSGKKPVVLLQNSGIGNLINPYSSLLKVHDANIFFVIGYRGNPQIKDEIQHEFMGKITKPLLSLLELNYIELNGNSTIEDQIRKDTNCILIGNDTIDKNMQNILNDSSYNKYSSFEMINKIINEISEDDYIFSTTGYISRELFTISNRIKNFYNVGAMGCVSSIAKAFAKFSNSRVLIFDGDGSFLMRLENNLNYFSSCKPVLHFVFNNEVYNSTGSQKTNISNINFKALAKGLGYDKFYSIFSPSKIKNILKIKKI